MKQFNIAIVGLGQIGNYLYNELITKKKDIEIKTGKKIKLVGFTKRWDTKKENYLQLFKSRDHFLHQLL